MSQSELFRIERRTPEFKTNLRRGWRIYAIMGHYARIRLEEESSLMEDVLKDVLNFMAKNTGNEKLLEIKPFSNSVGLTVEEAKKMIAEFIIYHVSLFHSDDTEFSEFWAEVEL